MKISIDNVIIYWYTNVNTKEVWIISKTITIRVDENLHKEFKIYSAKNDKDMTEILLEYIMKLLDEDKNQDNKK